MNHDVFGPGRESMRVRHSSHCCLETELCR